MYELDRNILNCHLSGFAHYAGPSVFGELKVGTELFIQAEPDNPYDPEAVAVFYGDKKIGFLPKDRNDILCRTLLYSSTNPYEVFINRISPEVNPDRQIGIVVRVKDTREHAKEN